ncbi:hypothetical protein [uncultured Endozoicomonas sp.]|uniref:hypothetical protein n=1 Tax=uncultured Endozoicomonas sp. TaxID=432652 RepID=UPI002610C6DD|nr:hypothetical protein [uncultured Endozoicomonas sp.]
MKTTSKKLFGTVPSITSGQPLTAIEERRSRLRKWLGLPFIRMLVLTRGTTGLRISESWYYPREIIEVDVQ